MRCIVCEDVAYGVYYIQVFSYAAPDMSGVLIFIQLSYIYTHQIR